jgi:hypothetical protein
MTSSTQKQLEQVVSICCFKRHAFGGRHHIGMRRDSLASGVLFSDGQAESNSEDVWQRSSSSIFRQVFARFQSGCRQASVESCWSFQWRYENPRDRRGSACGPARISRRWVVSDTFDVSLTCQAFDGALIAQIPRNRFVPACSQPLTDAPSRSLSGTSLAAFTRYEGGGQSGTGAREPI